MKPKTPTPKKCIICYNNGFWPIGDLYPIGKLDSEEWGKKVIKCPWCGGGFVTDDKQGKYKFLLDQKRKMESKAKGEKKWE
jgi:hypothetical protein